MKPKETKFLPILLGSDENAYGCARLFYDGYGIKPLLLCASPLPPTSYSRILIRKIIKKLDTGAVFKGIMEELLPALKTEAKKLLLVPCSDYYAELVIKNRGLISKYSETPIISEELYKRFSDKIAFHRLCSERNLPHPETVILTAEQLLSAPVPFEFPIVIKPRNSNSFSYLHLNMKNRKKVYFCKSGEEARECARMLLGAGYTEPLTVQRYIKGEKALTVNAYCDKNGRVRLIGAASPILEYRSPLLIGNYAALRTVKERTVCDKIITFLEDIGYVGFVNFDLIFDEKRNEYLFLELNPRQGRSSYYIHTAGENLMKALVDDTVSDTPYLGVSYAEKEGIWSNISTHLLKSEVDSSVLKNTPIDSAISPWYDFSPSRAYTLLRRDLGSIKLLRE